MIRMEEELEKYINVLQKIIQTSGSKSQEKLQASRVLEVKNAELEKIIEHKLKVQYCELSADGIMKVKKFQIFPES